MSQKRIAIANQKGGVGKTTTSVNLAASLAAAGHKTLLIDLDPQGNASSGLGADRHASSTIYHVLIGEKELIDATQQTKVDNLFVCTANQDLIGAEVELINSISRERKLKAALKSIENDFEFIVFDCPPSLGLLTINAFTASDSVIIPTQCEYYSLEGLGQLLNTFQLVKDELNDDLYIEGILLTMFDPRNKLTHEVVKELEQHFPQQLFKTRIPRNVKLSEAPSFGAPVLVYDKESKGCTAYLQLAEEVLVNNQFEKPNWAELFKTEEPVAEQADVQQQVVEAFAAELDAQTEVNTTVETEEVTVAEETIKVAPDEVVPELHASVIEALPHEAETQEQSSDPLISEGVAVETTPHQQADVVEPTHEEVAEEKTTKVEITEAEEETLAAQDRDSSSVEINLRTESSVDAVSDDSGDEPETKDIPIAEATTPTTDLTN